MKCRNGWPTFFRRLTQGCNLLGLFSTRVVHGFKYFTVVVLFFVILFQGSPGLCDQTEKSLEEEPSEDSATLSFALLLGAVYWPNLGDVDPSGSLVNTGLVGQFNTWGFNAEVAGHGHLAQWGRAGLWVGGDLGFHFNQGTGNTTFPIGPSRMNETVGYTSGCLYLTPSARLVLGKAESWRLRLGAGGGWYHLTIIAKVAGSGIVLDETETKNVFGGYLSLGVDTPPPAALPRVRLRLESKVHLVDFGSLGNFPTNSGNLTGPITVIQLGIVWE